jgi:hypothetical protein
MFSWHALHGGNAHVPRLLVQVSNEFSWFACRAEVEAWEDFLHNKPLVSLPHFHRCQVHHQVVQQELYILRNNTIVLVNAS